jgi:hypothetical protein
MNMKKKFIAVFFPMIGLLIWSLIIMINSFKTEEAWHITFAITGFITFLVLTGLFVYYIKTNKDRKKIKNI